MITSKRHNTAEEYPIATLLQHLQHALTPTQLDRTPLAPVRPHRTRHARPNPSVPVPCPTHPHRPQHLATTPQTPPTTPLPQSDPVPNLAAPRGGVVAPARSVPCPRRYHTGQPLDGAGAGRGGTPAHHSRRVESRAGQHQRRVAAIVRGAARRAAGRVATGYSCVCIRGLWSPQLFAAIVRNRWHPLMRINAQGNFRPLWGRRARALASLCPARAGQQVALAGEAFRYRLRCTLVVFWGEGAQEPWYLLTDLPARAVCGSWYGYRMWIEQGFRWLKRGCFGWHRCRVGSAAGMDWVWLVYALGCLLVVRAGLSEACGVILWDRHRRSASVLLLGLMSLLVKCWRAVVRVDSEILSFSSGGEPE
jgi:hypothetical protein